MKNLKYTRFEKARIIGARALQISMGAPIVINELKNINLDPLTVSMIEFDKKVIPITTKDSK